MHLACLISGQRREGEVTFGEVHWEVTLIVIAILAVVVVFILWLKRKIKP